MADPRLPDPSLPGVDDDSDEIPSIADDASPERTRVPDPQEAALPSNRPQGVTAFGTTVDEQREGESLDQKVAREVPENTDVAGDEPLEFSEADEPLPADRDVEELSYEEFGDLPADP
jgi:hypothetical protein